MSEPTQDAIGKLLDETQGRDAIHIAVYPVVAFAGDAPIAAWTSGKGESSLIRVEVRR